SVNDFLCRIDNGVADLRIELSECHIRACSGLLDDTECTDDRKWLLLPADLEIAKGTLRLRAPISVILDFDRAERICLGTGGGHCHAFLSRCLSEMRSYRSE